MIPEKNSLIHKLRRFFGFSNSSNQNEESVIALHTSMEKIKEQSVIEVQTLDTAALQNKSAKKKKGNQELCPSAYACGARMYLGNR